MSIIIISSDFYKTGREIGEKAANAIDYNYIDVEILIHIAKKYKVQEKELIKALKVTPRFFSFSSKLRNKYLTYIQNATLEYLLKDNVICHGLAAHLYTKGITHALRVRVLSNTSKLASQFSSEFDGSVEKTIKILKHNEENRKYLSLKAFSMDETDPSNYDMLIDLNKINPNDAVKNISAMIAKREFQPITYSKKCLRDKELAARVRIELMEQFPDVRVHADGNTVMVDTKAMMRGKQKRITDIKGMVSHINGVDHVEVHVGKKKLRPAEINQ